MNTLHLIFSLDGLTDCLRVAGTNDTLVLLQDGAYADTGTIAHSLCAISEDAEARGVDTRLADAVRRIDYDDLVQLVETHKPIVSWAR